MSIQPNMQRLMEEVRDGKLDFALTKPEDSQVLVSVRDVRIWRSASTSSPARPCSPTASPGSIAASDWSTRSSSSCSWRSGRSMIYCFWLAALDACVLDRQRVAGRRALRRHVLQTGRFPVSIYPAWFRIGVTFLVPIAFAITVPAEAVTSRLDWATVALALGFGAALFVFTRRWWRFALRFYSGASA